jgi:hypothetical protein
MKQCWYDVKFGCSAQNELTQLISFYIHFALKLAKVWWAFFQNKISRIEVFDLQISTYKQFLNSYVFGSWWAFNINHGQCPNYGGSHGVPDPLVILWGLLNAGLNRGSGDPGFFTMKPWRPPENFLIIRALTTVEFTMPPAVAPIWCWFLIKLRPVGCILRPSSSSYCCIAID